MKKSKLTTAQDWLKMDLKSQSGSIWTDEKSKLQKEKKSQPYEKPNLPPHILMPDTEDYGKVKISSETMILE